MNEFFSSNGKTYSPPGSKIHFDSKETEEDEVDAQFIKELEQKCSLTTKSNFIFCDEDAQIVYEEFSTEFARLSEMKISEERLYHLCDYLIEKYLDQKLDKMEQVPRVVEVKQKVSACIEEFASQVIKYSLSATSNAAVRDNQVPKATTIIPVLKNSHQNGSKKEEIIKIKKQYENYMNIKKQAVSHPDEQTIQEYEKLNSEIKGILTSIQTGQSQHPN